MSASLAYGLKGTREFQLPSFTLLASLADNAVGWGGGVACLNADFAGKDNSRGMATGCWKSPYNFDLSGLSPAMMQVLIAVFKVNVSRNSSLGCIEG